MTSIGGFSVDRIKSFVDAPFFAELAKWKLNDAKLSEDSVPISGSMIVPRSVNQSSSIHLSGRSWGTESLGLNQSVQEFTIGGELTNFNTIEVFRDLDKLEAVKTSIKQLAQSISDVDTWENPSRIAEFKLITFADLKKYKFYYWFMFPSLNWAKTVAASHLDEPASNQLNTEIAAYKQLFFAIHRSDDQFVVDALNTTTGEVGMVDFGSIPNQLPYYLANLAALLKSHTKLHSVRVYLYGSHSRWISLDLDSVAPVQQLIEGGEGWERNSQGRLVPKLTDLSSLMNPKDLAEQAVDLNLKLMKWRASPEIDLESVKSSHCLLLGAGTLGCYLARGLMAWGVRKITFVDSGTVSYSNPVRQSLFCHEDCVKSSHKAETAAKALKDIFPGVDAQGYALEIPMAGHPINNEARQKAEYDQLLDLINTHDTIFLLMDSRESRWLPTVICQALKKTVINVAIGFDSYLVMRHGVPGSDGEPSQLGCYYCNDVVAPIDSLSKLSLDQMCTVTRPGVAMLASGQAVELTSQVLQHPLKARAPANAESVLGEIPHQLRGFLRRHETVPIWGPSFKNCSACSPEVVNAWTTEGWEFVKKALNNEEYVTELCGLGELQRKTEQLDFDDDALSSANELD